MKNLIKLIELVMGLLWILGGFMLALLTIYLGFLNIQALFTTLDVYPALLLQLSISGSLAILSLKVGNWLATK